MNAPGAPSLLEIHQKLKCHFGELHWWPAESAFEVLIGAILTQNTAWNNVEKAIAGLKQAGVLDATSLSQVPRTSLEELIRPAGYFRQKAERLQLLAKHLTSQWHGQVETWCAGPLDEVRQRLLRCKGIGPETADSILLYAAHRPSFVVDAYTRRVFERLGVLAGGETYETIRYFFMAELPHDTELFNAYHAEIVQLAKEFCRKHDPACPGCPLLSNCGYGRAQSRNS